MTRSIRAARPWALSLAALGCALGMVAGPAAPVASAQLPAGMSLQDVQSVISAPISVPAGETVSVDLGVPVSTSYAGGGWSVSSAGSVVTVTAPTTPGAQASVPASAAGQSATITLVAEENAAAPALPEPDSAAPEATFPDRGGAAQAPAGEGSADAADAAPAGQESAPAPTAGEAASAAPTPERAKAEPADTSDTRYVELDAVIEGRSISAQLGLGLAADLYRQFQGVDQDSVKLRYLDVNGQVIEGVTRDVDVASRSLILTYPEGQTPDNPFILEVVRDGAAILVVRLVAEDHPVAEAGDGTDAPAESDRTSEASLSSDKPVPAVALILAAVALAVIVAVVAVAAARSRRKRQG